MVSSKKSPVGIYSQTGSFHAGKGACDMFGLFYLDGRAMNYLLR